jgi:hypothetical protein
MSIDNLPPGVSDWDIPGYGEFYETLINLECPNCGHIHKSLEVLGDWNRRNRIATFWATCDQCDHEWSWEWDGDDA